MNLCSAVVLVFVVSAVNVCSVQQSVTVRSDLATQWPTDQNDQWSAFSSLNCWSIPSFGRWLLTSVLFSADGLCDLQTNDAEKMLLMWDECGGQLWLDRCLRINIPPWGGVGTQLGAAAFLMFSHLSIHQYNVKISADIHSQLNDSLLNKL